MKQLKSKYLLDGDGALSYAAAESAALVTGAVLEFTVVPCDILYYQ